MGFVTPEIRPFPKESKTAPAGVATHYSHAVLGDEQAGATPNKQWNDFPTRDVGSKKDFPTIAPTEDF
jgi:hypothetical protein